MITEADRTAYAGRFATEAQVKSSVHDSLNNNIDNIQGVDARIDALKNSLSANSLISNNIKRISEPYLLLMFRTVACFGLPRWAPDVLSYDPDSMYNLLHEYIALTTFEQVSAGYGYSHIGINLSLVRNFSLMRKFYRSFVFSYLRNIAKLEVKTPGAVVKTHEREIIVKRRSNVCCFTS